MNSVLSTTKNEQVENNSQKEIATVDLSNTKQSKSKPNDSNILASKPRENKKATKNFIQGINLVKSKNETLIKSESNVVNIKKQVPYDLSDLNQSDEITDDQTRIVLTPALKLKSIEIENLESAPNTFNFISAIKTRRPFQFGFTLGMSFLKPTANGDNVRSFDIGLVAKKKISNQFYLSVEPSLQWSTGYDQLHVVQRVDNFGLEVTSDFFAIQPKHVINGKVILGLGWERNRWAVQLSPQLLFAPQGYGSLNSLKNDTGNYTYEREIQEGWITTKNTSPFTYGAEVGIMYQIKWNAQMQISTGWRNALFFKEQEIRRTDDEPALHIGFQYRQYF